MGYDVTTLWVYTSENVKVGEFDIVEGNPNTAIEAAQKTEEEFRGKFGVTLDLATPTTGRLDVTIDAITYKVVENSLNVATPEMKNRM